MPITLPNPDLSGTIDDTEIEANFTTIVNRFDGNIKNEDCSSSMALAVTKLAAYTSEVFVQLKYRFPDTGGTAFSALSDGVPCDVCALPEDDGAAAFTITNAQWVCNDTGNNATTFDVRLGYYDTSGTFQTVSTPIAEEVITNANANDDANNADCTIDSASVSLTRTSSRPLFLALTRGGTAGSGTVDSENDFLQVTIRLTRNIQAS